MSNIFTSIFIKKLDKFLTLYEPRERRYLWREVQKRATDSSVDFIVSKMPNAMFCMDPLQVLECGIDFRREGLIAEFGVFEGKTINHIASLVPHETIFGFDSFEGLPEYWTGYYYVKKWFDKQGKLPHVKPNVKLIKGWFDATVPPFFKEQNKPISIFHFDADLYSSTKIVLDHAKPYIQSGTIFIFDEFFNYPNYQQHEYKAFFEFIEETKMNYDFIAYSGSQVAVKLL